MFDIKLGGQCMFMVGRGRGRSDSRAVQRVGEGLKLLRKRSYAIFVRIRVFALKDRLN